MSKDIKYTTDISDINSKFIIKQPSKRYKSRTAAWKNMCSERTININNISKVDRKVVISRSYVAKMYTYIDSPAQLMKQKRLISSSQNTILNMYKTLCGEPNTIICKQSAFRRMKDLSSYKNHVNKNSTNSHDINLHGLRLDDHIRAYLYAMVYPPIFEVCTATSQDAIFSKYPMLLEMWCNMLEDSIIADGILMFVDRFVCNYLKNTDNCITYNRETRGQKHSKNYWNRLIDLYMPNMVFSCLIDGECFDINNPHIDRHMKTMMNYKFILSDNHIKNKNNKIAANIPKLNQIYINFFEHIEQETNKKESFLRIFSLYHLNISSHIFDILWHNDFPKIDFHFIDGLITNYTLHKIMNQITHIIPEIIKDDDYEDSNFGLEYTCDAAMEISLKDSISEYDLCFLNSLIKRCCNSLEKYDFCFAEQRARKIWESIHMLNDMKIVNNFNENPLIFKNQNENPYLINTDKIQRIFRESESYYKQIYKDINYKF